MMEKVNQEIARLTAEWQALLADYDPRTYPTKRAHAHDLSERIAAAYARKRALLNERRRGTA